MKRRTLLYVTAIIVVLTFLVLLGLTLLPRTDASTPANAPLVRTVSVPQGEPFAAQTLRLSRFTYTITSHELLDVDIEIENVTSERQSGIAWYILAPPGDPEPWRTAVFSAPEQTIAADPGQRVTLTFGAPDDDSLEGEYQLSVWVHGIAGGERFHSDGAGAPDNLYIGPVYSFRISEIGQERTSSGESSLSVTFYIRNNLTEPIDLEMSYTLSQPNAERPWENALYTLPFKDTRLDPGEEYVATYRNLVDLPAGAYQLIGWLHQNMSGQGSVEVARFTYPELIDNP